MKLAACSAVALIALVGMALAQDFNDNNGFNNNDFGNDNGFFNNDGDDNSLAFGGSSIVGGGGIASGGIASGGFASGGIASGGIASGVSGGSWESSSFGKGYYPSYPSSGKGYYPSYPSSGKGYYPSYPSYGKGYYPSYPSYGKGYMPSYPSSGKGYGYGIAQKVSYVPLPIHQKSSGFEGILPLFLLLILLPLFLGNRSTGTSTILG